MHVGTLIAYVRRDLGSIVKCCTVPTSGTWRYQRTSPPLKPGCYHSVWIFVADTMSMTKRVLYPARLRRVRAHLIWLDHRLVREPYREWAEVTAWALSLFLVCVADVHGLSDESGLRLGRPLGLSPAPPRVWAAASGPPSAADRRGNGWMGVGRWAKRWRGIDRG